MTALFCALRAQDRVAVKPHASRSITPSNSARPPEPQKLEDFRGYKGAQSYPPATKDSDDVDFSRLGRLGRAQTRSPLVQDYVRAHGWH